MPQNLIQFQKGYSLQEFMSAFPDEDSCMRALVAARWPQGFVCPRCNTSEHCQIFRRAQPLYQCAKCRKQTSATAGTLFAESKLPLRTWFCGLYVLIQNKNNVSALELKRHLGICYRSAWRMKHKLMVAMASEEQSRTLRGLVQIDDAYLGGEKMGAKCGRGSPNKQGFIAAVSLCPKGYPLHSVFHTVQSFTKKEVARFAAEHLEPETEVLTDGLACFNAFEEADFARTVVVSSSARLAAKSESMKWVNVVLGNLKRAMGGTYHSIKVFKYAQRYLDEFAWRFNRRFNLSVMLSQLLSAAVKHTPSPETKLRRPAINQSC